MRIRAVDIETTGLTPPDHTICEVGWADLAEANDHAGDWHIVHTGETFCSPGRPIPPEVSAIHHIVDEDCVGAPPWRQTIEQVCGLSGLFMMDAICAHNARFERQWIGADITGRVEWICSYKCALKLWPEAPSHSNQALRYWLKPEGLNRSIAAVSHRAMPDAYVTAYLLREMLKQASVADLIAWTKEPAILPRFTFGMHIGKKYSDVDTSYLSWLLAKDFDEDVKHTARLELSRRKQSAKGGA
ncbi:MAG: exonuclease domain-containing protein [Beijerinckiaceae bacterium]|nr:exonuclease domain-containing protein [Beijerinckiaceae bacterium]